MEQKAGSLLEKNVEMILDEAGLDTVRNAQLKGYEIDVLGKLDGKKVIVECKQREKSSVNVRNLIHQWKGKNEDIKADKIVLALYGISVTNEHLKLAEENDVEIWTGEDIHNYLKRLQRSEEDWEDLRAKLYSSTDYDPSRKSWKPEWASIRETLRKEYSRQKFKNLAHRDSKFKVYGFYEGIKWDNQVKVLEEHASTISFKHIEQAVKEAQRKKEVNTLLIVQSATGKNKLAEHISKNWVKLAERNDIKCLIGRYEPKKEIKWGLPPQKKESEDSLRNRSKISIYSLEEAWER